MKPYRSHRIGALSRMVDTMKATTGIEPVFRFYPWISGECPSPSSVDRERVRDAVRSIEWFGKDDA